MPVDERLAAEALAAAVRISEAQVSVEQARLEFQRAVRAIYVEGASMREIAERLGISHQRVHQLLDLPKREDDSGRRRGKRSVLACSFCKRDQSDVHKLIAGPKVFICDSCVALARSLVHSEDSDAFAESAYVRLWRSADTPRCSFCGKKNDVAHPVNEGAVRIITAGTGSGVCQECLDLCQEIIADETD